MHEAPSEHLKGQMNDTEFTDSNTDADVPFNQIWSVTDQRDQDNSSSYFGSLEFFEYTFFVCWE